MLLDIGVLTAGTVISEETGHTLEGAQIQMLGQASRVIIDKDNTVIVNGAGDDDVGGGDGIVGGDDGVDPIRGQLGVIGIGLLADRSHRGTGPLRGEFPLHTDLRMTGGSQQDGQQNSDR